LACFKLIKLSDNLILNFSSHSESAYFYEKIGDMWNVLFTG